MIPSFALKLGFDGLVVVGVGAGGFISQHLAFGDLADEQHVATQVQLLQHTAAKHSIGVIGEVNEAVVAAGKAHEIRELIRFPSGLHTEMTDGFKGHILENIR